MSMDLDGLWRAELTFELVEHWNANATEVAFRVVARKALVLADTAQLYGVGAKVQTKLVGLFGEEVFVDVHFLNGSFEASDLIEPGHRSRCFFEPANE